ncbi:CHAT domain-containing protein [Kitasatospora sp. NPDC058965]|uniref:CHAT domain-containing protein n=1 Tax=Kitasatospora sp. NPDC058965 TaxID=3346682 RepID=UPI0036B1B360
MSGPEISIGALLDREPVPANTAVVAAESESPPSKVTPSLTVTVVWGDLAQVPADVHVTGHYQGVAPTAAELALDRAISGESHHLIAEHTRHGWINGKLGEVQYFPSKGEPVKRAAVVGMGQVGTFTERRAALMYESLWAELMTLGDVRTAATVLIGAGAGNLPLAQAARALLRGLAAAPPVDSTELTEVLVVEQDRLRADQLVRALLAEAGTVPGVIHVTADFRPEAGGRLSRSSATVYAVKALTRLIDGSSTAGAADRSDPDEAGRAAAMAVVMDGVDAPIRDSLRAHLADLVQTDPAELALAVTQETTDRALPVRITVRGGEDGLYWSALTALATLPERRVPVDWELLKQLIDRLTEPSQQDTEQLPSLLSRLVVPVDFQHLVADESAVVLDLDRTTALLPWEFLSDIRKGLDAGAKPLAVRTPIARRLRTEYTGVGPENVAGEMPRALVIGDAGDAAHRLDGARKEAVETVKTLKSLGVQVTAFLGSPDSVPSEQPDFGELDIEVATRLDTLRVLLSSGYDIVHYCGHGDYVPGEGRRSGWQFADGLLTGRELMNLERPPRMVLANACWSSRTGTVPVGGRTGPATEERLAVKPAAQFVSTLADEFLRAGVAHYIGAAWRVPDQLAVTFARRFYAVLLNPAEGGPAPVGDAVRAAREAVYGERAHQDAGSHYLRHSAWAAYQHYGDPTAKLMPSATTRRLQ